MKILLLGSAIFFMSQMCFGQSNNFYDKILRYDNCSYCYFIAVNVESKKYSGTIIVENNKFQDFFKKTKRLNKSQYIDFMKDVFESKKKDCVERRLH